MTPKQVLEFAKKNGCVMFDLKITDFPGAHLGDERFDVYGSEGQLRLPDPYGADPLQVYTRQAWPAFGLPAETWTALTFPPAPI